MSLKLRNRKAAESQLGQFIEDISIPPKLISGIVDGEARILTHVSDLDCGLLTHALVLPQTNEAYVQYLVQLHNRLEFAATKARPCDCCRLVIKGVTLPFSCQGANTMALQDVESELERLRVKAAGKVRGLNGMESYLFTWICVLILSTPRIGSGVPSAALLWSSQTQDQYPGALYTAAETLGTFAKQAHNAFVIPTRSFSKACSSSSSIS